MTCLTLPFGDASWQPVAVAAAMCSPAVPELVRAVAPTATTPADASTARTARSVLLIDFPLPGEGPAKRPGLARSRAACPGPWALRRGEGLRLDVLLYRAPGPRSSGAPRCGDRPSPRPELEREARRHRRLRGRALPALRQARR